MVQPQSVTGEGLSHELEGALGSLGISSIDTTSCPRLVGLATDGESTNIAKGGLQGLVEAKLG